MNTAASLCWFRPSITQLDEFLCNNVSQIMGCPSKDHPAHLVDWELMLDMREFTVSRVVCIQLADDWVNIAWVKDSRLSDIWDQLSTVTVRQREVNLRTTYIGLIMYLLSSFLYGSISLKIKNEIYYLRVSKHNIFNLEMANTSVTVKKSDLRFHQNKHTESLLHDLFVSL